MGTKVAGGGRNRTTSARAVTRRETNDRLDEMSQSGERLDALRREMRAEKITIDAGPWVQQGSLLNSRIGQVRSAVAKYDRQYGVQGVSLNGLGHIDILFSTRLNRRQVKGVQRGFRGIDSRAMDSDTGTSVRIYP